MSKDEAGHSDPKAARKYGKDYVKRVSKKLTTNVHHVTLLWLPVFRGGDGVDFISHSIKLMRGMGMQTYRDGPLSAMGKWQ